LKSAFAPLRSATIALAHFVVSLQLPLVVPIQVPSLPVRTMLPPGLSPTGPTIAPPSPPALYIPAKSDALVNMTAAKTVIRSPWKTILFFIYSDSAVTPSQPTAMDWVRSDDWVKFVG